MENEIGTWFLILSLILPRFTLFFWWLSGNLPFNQTPIIADFFASILVPRLLIMVWIYDLQGMSAWFWIHFGVFALIWTFGILRASASTKKSFNE